MRYMLRPLARPRLSVVPPTLHSRRQLRSKTIINEAGVRSTGREDARIGVAAAQHFVAHQHEVQPRPQIFDEFSLKGRVAVVTGGNGGLGLEMAIVLAEQGAKVYCLDLAESPRDEVVAAQRYVDAFGAEIKYRTVDVTDQPAMRQLCKEIADAEGSLDVCVAAAGLLHGASCLEYDIQDFQRIMNVNVNGVFITASASAAQMARLERPGSIILIASMSGSITNREDQWVAYNSSKSAVLQMGRSMACELGSLGIRVNTLSPGHIKTAMTEAFLSKNPELETRWKGLNPLGRLGKVHEVRGVVAWLASDASSFCTGSDILVSGGQHAW